MDTQELKNQVNELMRNQKYDEIEPLLFSHREKTRNDNDLAVTYYLCSVYKQEKAAGQPVIFSKVLSVEELMGRYTVLKFYLRRIDFDVADGLEEFQQFLIEARVSPHELLRVIDYCVVHKEKVLKAIEGGLPQKAAGGLWAMPERGETCTGAADGEEICFIICTNDPVYAKECIYYIDHLKVPEGMQIDVLTVEEAKSLTAGYNEAMKYSRAKYKVYLHHDTFIVNPDFIRDCVEIFKNDPQVGMIGNVGVDRMPVTGIMWDVDRYGMLYEQHVYETELLSNPISPDMPYMEAEAIDGFIMITQYDVPWREDLFTKWDFYDCSQSMEFIRHGYKVIVPNMKEPWCVHDCGFIDFKNYDGEKAKYVAEYVSGGRCR